MKLLIAGGTGFIGTALIHSLPKKYKITVVGRDAAHIQQQFKERVQPCTWQELPELDASSFEVVVNLAGYNISASPWTEEVKAKIIQSRVDTNLGLINWLIQNQCKPRFYSANAIGIYGLQEDGALETFDEDTPINLEHSRDFLSQVGIQWQTSLQPAIEYGMPVTVTRFGVVLKRGEGMLKKLAPSFYLGLGSILGSGKQIISWVHIADVVQAFHFLFAHPELTGAFNVTSPHPTSQKQFAKELAQVLHRPLWIKMPASIIRILFGEMGECLLNHGQRVYPKRLLKEGYEFRYPKLHEALAYEFKKKT